MFTIFSSGPVPSGDFHCGRNRRLRLFDFPVFKAPVEAFGSLENSSRRRRDHDVDSESEESSRKANEVEVAPAPIAIAAEKGTKKKTVITRRGEARIISIMIQKCPAP